MNRLVLQSLVFSVSIILASGGYDHGTSAGKGNFDLSLTWNPFNYFNQGQSYAVIGYGLTDRLDIHSYYSFVNRENDNYYGGFFYQFYKSKWIDLATAIGVRKYKNKEVMHLFMPQLLYTIYLTEKVHIGGSIVDIKNYDSMTRKGTAIDTFFIFKIFEKKNYIVDITIGGFNPVMWQPDKGNWHPTYSIDIKLKTF